MPALIVALAAVVLVFATAVFGAAFGALAGWIVGGVFPDTFDVLITGILNLPPSVEPWQIGAILGFVGGFFRSTNTNNCSCKKDDD